jgi:hypothetical protein
MSVLECRSPWWEGASGRQEWEISGEIDIAEGRVCNLQVRSRGNGVREVALKGYVCLLEHSLNVYP